VPDIALVAVDLDGTLLTSEGVPEREGARALREAASRGVRVVLATTRTPGTTAELCRQIGIADPIVCTNGAQIWASPDGPAWACHAIPREAAETIARLADAHGWELSTTVGGTTYWRQRPGQPLGPLRPRREVVRTNLDAVTGDPVRILAQGREAIEAIRDLCQSTLAWACRTETYIRPDGALHSLGIFAAGVDKGTGLSVVLERLGVDAGQVMAVGDNPNDLPMFACAGLSVAMGNAPPHVRRSAAAVVPSNDDGGVAWALRRFVLGPTGSS
jgi:hydroxymethylpyrimidine pyrophosphatase-like HAD family hydrolase